MLEVLMNTLLPVTLVIIAGAVYDRIAPISIDQMNRVNMDIFVPALIISALAKPLPDLNEISIILIVAIVLVILPGILIWPLSKKLGWKNKTLLPPMMFRNSGNLGIPLLVLAFGEQVLPLAVLLFLIENTLHFTLGMMIVHGRVNLLSLLKTPMINATIIGLTLAFLNIKMPVSIERSVDLLGQIAIPLMLFTLGVRIKDIQLSAWREGVIGSFLSIGSGLAAFGLMYWLFDLPDGQWQVLFIFAVLPPAVLNYLVAERYQIEPAKVATLVLFANMLFIVWMLFLLPASYQFN